jgi:hypothetical protein
VCSCQFYKWRLGIWISAPPPSSHSCPARLLLD